MGYKLQTYTRMKGIISSNVGKQMTTEGFIKYTQHNITELNLKMNNFWMQHRWHFETTAGFYSLGPPKEYRLQLQNIVEDALIIKNTVYLFIYL